MLFYLCCNCQYFVAVDTEEKKDYSHCPKCGSFLLKECTKCKKPILEAVRFCPFCGKLISEALERRRSS